MLLDNGGQAETGQMTQWSSVAGNSNQQWRVLPLSGDVYMLISLTSGMALDDGGNVTSGSVVTQYDASTSNPNQQWHLVSLGGDDYRLVNVASGKALDNGGTLGNGDLVHQTDVVSGSLSQTWTLAPVQIGAKTPFVTFEAEAGMLLGGASVVSLTAPPATLFSSPELEASGHAFVHLAAKGQQVSWTNTTGKPMTAVNLRYSIPDSAGGGGIDSSLDLYVNGVFRQSIPVTSRQTWGYETQDHYDGMDENPANGNPHVFWDEAHAFVKGAAIAPGDTVTLRKDAANAATWYNVDLLELEAPPLPLAQPGNSLSIVDCGAVANNASFDSSAAIQKCFDQAQASGKSVWIPQGTFYVANPQGLGATGISIEGAGMWYSTLYYNPPKGSGNPNYFITPWSSTLRNFAIDGNAVDNSQTGNNGGGVNIKGSHWHIDSIWIQHEGPGIWGNGEDGLVENCRINSVWADGINLNNGNSVPGNNLGNRLTARNNFVRGSGDDGLAINDGGGDTLPMHDITLINNTSVAPFWANNIGIYGGINDTVANNLTHDSVKEYGISVGRFGQNGSLDTALVEGNTVERGGSHGYGNPYSAVGLGVTGTVDTVRNIIFRGNTITNAMFDGVHFQSQSTVWVQYTTVVAPGLGGYVIENGATGEGVLWYNNLSGLRSGQPGFVGSPSTFPLDTRGNIGLGTP
jgi:hypothetical protein